jgi:hypothetical protein
MPQEPDIYEQLLQKGFSKRDIHSALHKAIMLQIQHNKATGGKHTSLHKKASHTVYHKPFAFSKESHFLKNLISAVVSFIKTQFAKKPKNPV